MTDDEFASAFEALALPPSVFRHADHVRPASDRARVGFVTPDRVASFAAPRA